MIDFIMANSVNFFVVLLFAMLAVFIFVAGVAITIDVMRHTQTRELKKWVKIVLKNGNLMLFTLNEKRNILPYVTRKNTEQVLSELIAELSSIDEVEHNSDILLLKSLKDEYIRWEKLQTIQSPIARGSLEKLAAGKHYAVQDIDLLIDELDRILTIENANAEKERRISRRSYLLAFFGLLFSLPSLVMTFAPYLSKMFE